MARRLKAATTHFHNLGEAELGKGDQEAVNHQGVGLLVAPDAAPGFSTHSTQTAGTKFRKQQKAVSIADLPNEEEPDLDLDDDLDNYAPAQDDFDDLELDNSGMAAGDLELPDGEFTAELEDEPDLEDDDLDEDSDEDDEITSETEDDVMDVVDVDDMPEEVEEEEIDVAVVEAGLLVLRGDRVIAKMTKAEAEEEGIEDEYQSEEFASVVASVCATKGLRRGLSELGFQMATVNLGASHVVKAQVEARARETTKKLEASLKDQSKSLEACLALAAVGINKGFWKDVQNPLRAAVEASLLHAGVQNPKTVASRLFAASGVDYAKAMVTVAQRLAAMPEATRNTLAEALDFTNDQVEEDEDFVEGEAEDFDDDDVSDFQDIEAATIEAALSKPGRKQTAKLLQPKVPVTARTILSSSDILEF